VPSLTDAAIRQAIKRVEIAGKQESLTDGEGRGTGRLVLVLKSMPRRVTAEWMAQQWRDGKRAKAKLGDYMPEKRAGMKKWDKFVTSLLTKKRHKLAA
jgi:hypothetical protein